MFQSWQSLVSALGFFFALTYAITAVVAGASSKDPRLKTRRWSPLTPVVAPVAFVLSSQVLYWSSWSQTWPAAVLFVLTVPVAVIVMLRDRKIFTPVVLLNGLWMLIFVLFILAVSAVGSFGGAGILPSPLDSIIVAFGSVAFYVWGQRSSIAWMKSDASVAAAGIYY
jgi:hypothetical protein